MKKLLLAVLCAALPLTAQPIRFSTPQPISINRTGIAGGQSSDPVIASNGESFLVAWADDLAYLESRRGPIDLIGKARAIRMSSDGAFLDDVAVGTNLLFPFGAAWTGSEWIVGTFDGFARISADGELIATRKGPWVGGTFFIPEDIAWTGDALVLVGTGQSYQPLRALTFDAQLNLIRDEVIAEQARPLGFASDGQSALLLYRQLPFQEAGTSVAGALFGRDGLVKMQRLILSNRAVYGGGLAATDHGYLWFHKTPTPDAMWIDKDLRPSPAQTLDEFPGSSTGDDPVVWDGSRVTSFTMSGSNTLNAITAAQFSDSNGTFLPPLQTIINWNLTSLDLAAAAANGTTLLGYVRAPNNTVPPQGLMVRAFSNPAAFAFAAETPVERGVFKQELFAAASAPSTSLVVWHERTSASMPWSIFATRVSRNATVVDPSSLLLGQTSCVKVPPAVATDGRDFLAAWMDANQIVVASVRADGTTQQTNVVTNVNGCGAHPLSLTSNGTDYLLVWRTNDERLSALRFRGDGSRIDSSPIRIANLLANEGNTVRVASNGLDYLVAWDRRAMRVTSAGAVVDRFNAIQLGVGNVAQLWWNGTAYVAEMIDASGHRFTRVASDGSGGRPATGPQPTPSPFLFSGSWTMPQSLVCDAGGCDGAVVRKLPNNQYTIALVRYNDDGTNIAMRVRHAPDFAFDAPDDKTPVPAAIVDSGRLAVVYLPQLLAKPYSGAHRVLIAPAPPPRGRAVRH